MMARITALTSLILADVVTTWIGLSMGGSETNQVMAGIVASPLVHLAVKIGLILVLITALEISLRTSPRYLERGYLMLGTIYGFVMVQNLVQIVLMAIYTR